MKNRYQAIVIGTGCAGFASAERIYQAGIRDVCIFSDRILNGTSRNAGSDKQTYYKLDICSPHGDSIQKMAEDFFAGGSMHGTDAYLEAANSLPCFMHLCDLGVPFVKDEFGVYLGYQTDHDKTKRATSAGPLTSQYMTQALEKRVHEYGISVFDDYSAIRLLVKDNNCFGVCFLHRNQTVCVYADAVILCTGAPAGIYENSVYPIGQTGATGLAVEAGARLQNFQEWQYGIASVKFRWNLSGSYQQVIPRYVSVDSTSSEHEFLQGITDFASLTFLKGYQWPFDYQKSQSGSSQIDLAVAGELAKGKRVYLDYMHNPKDFSLSHLSQEAQNYLYRAGVNGATPYERLKQLNPKAIRLYEDNGIDLSREYLEIGVCAQHNNGGIQVDNNGQTSINGLYCAGEAAGRFGIYRPGGAALNDTQVGALLIADALKAQKKSNQHDAPTLLSLPKLPSLAKTSNVREFDKLFGTQMSAYTGVFRNTEKTEELLHQLTEFAKDYHNRVTIAHEWEYADYFKLYLTTLARIALCKTVLSSAFACGSRGGCICTHNGNILPENEKYRKLVTVTDKNAVAYEPVKPLPQYTAVFEKYLLKN